jgi:CDP-3, 6-dideoxy-D-glycero-L-glycero-4-hexulose-4-reductase
MKIFLITGARGFIGNNYIKNFSNKNNLYYILLKKSKNNKKFINSFKDKNKRFIFFKKNSEIYTSIKKLKINFFINFATHYTKDNNFKNTEQLIKSNILFPSLILESINKKYLKKVITFGSMQEHHQNKEYMPDCLYAATKKSLDKLFFFHKIKLTKIKFYNLKFYETYNTNDKRKKLVPIIKKNYINNLTTTLASKTLNLNFLHVCDVCRAVNIIINKNIKSGEYQIQAKKFSNPKKLIDKFNKINFKKIKYITKDNNIFNIDYNLKKLPYWKQTTSIENNFNNLLNENYKNKI